MYALSSFRRRLHSGGRERDVEIAAGTTAWVPAQQHYGENTGDTPSHSIFVELKEPGAGATTPTSAPTDPASSSRDLT